MTMANANSGDQYRPSLLDNLVGIGMKRSVVDERDELTRRYPDSLMALGGIKVHGFTVSLSYERTFQPEATARGRRLFQEVLQAIERAIAEFDVDVADPQSSHEVSPSVGDAEAGTSVVATPSVGDAAGPGVSSSTGPAAPFPDPFEVDVLDGSVRIESLHPLQYLSPIKARQLATDLRMAASIIEEGH